MSLDRIDLWSDGSAYPPYPGPAGMGAIGKVNGRVLFRVGEPLDHLATHNIAEYLAAITALSRALVLGARQAHLYVDSRLVVQQFHGNWRCRAAGLIPLLDQLRGLAEQFEAFDAEWIPRKENGEANDLAGIGSRAAREAAARSAQ